MRARFLSAVVALLLVIVSVPAHPAAAAPPVVRWGYYVTYDATSLASLQEHVGGLDIVSPYFLQLQESGAIASLGESAEALAAMRAAGVRIVPMIKNGPRWDAFHTLMATAAQREDIAVRLADYIVSQGYDGVHVDFEAVNAVDAPLLTDFMERLAARLRPAGKLVTQAVIARQSDTPTTWGGAYDYAALARINDYIAIMAYDYSSVGGSPGPVAPAWWVQDVVSYAKTRIPASKILLGMPLYGYDWNVTTGAPATSLRFEQTAALLARPGTTSGYDEEAQSPWLRYRDDSGNEHQVWYENADSFRAKLDIMLNDELSGFALWRLGHGDPGVWDERGRLATPATRIGPFPDTPDRRYFPETGHSLAYGFKAFWERSGGLPVFGYPLTEEFDEPNPDSGQVLTVQYLERQRFEYHPEHAGSAYEVELGRLGAAEAARRGLLATAPFQPLPPETGSDAACTFVPETGHRLCHGFRAYWAGHGLELGDPGLTERESLALFGYPLSEEFVDPATGRVTQYFERARFEYHPDNPEPYRILLGRLGAEELVTKGW